MKKIHYLFFLAAGLLNCQKDSILDPKTPDFSIIQGDTIKTRRQSENFQFLKKSIYFKKTIILSDTALTYQPQALHPSPDKPVDLEQLKSKNNEQLKGKPFRYIAFGGSVSAGVRDGSYFNEGMETSFPSLIARQLGIKDFNPPTFEKSDYNGYGRLVLATNKANYTGGPVLKFNLATNNSGFEVLNEKEATLKKVKDTRSVSNWAVPFSNRWEVRENFRIPQPFADRLGWRENRLYSNDGDLITMEHGFSDMIAKIIGTKDLNSYDFINGYAWGAASIVEEAAAILYNTKGKDVNSRKSMLCVFNIPDYIDLPIFHQITSADIEKSLLFGKEIVFAHYKPEELLWFPNSTLDSLLGKNVSLAAKDNILKRYKKREVSLGAVSSIGIRNGLSYYSGIVSYNIIIERLGRDYSFPIVDIKSMYARIRKGEYVTHDGIKVEFKYPHGNFFSLDGIHPTAFGQAVIANEVLSTLNKYYKIDIPLIPTKYYLK